MKKLIIYLIALLFSNVIHCQLKFNCQNCQNPSFYQVYSPTVSSPSVIASFDLNLGTYSPLPNSPANYQINAIGLNFADSLAYGIKWPSSNQLIKIDANGNNWQAGAINNLPIGNYDSGDFASDGYLHVRKNNGSTMYKINIQTLTVVGSYQFSTMVEPGDLTYNWQTGLFYGNDELSGSFFSLQPNSGIITLIGQNGIYTSFGAMYSDITGRVWGLHNSTGELFKFNISTGIPSLVANLNAATYNDGFNCKNTVLNDQLNYFTNVNSCNYFYWPLTNQTYYVSGQFQAIFSDQYGCDSTIIMDLIISSNDSVNIDTNSCYPIIINSQLLSASGVYYQTLQGSNSCDSIITINYTLNDQINSPIVQTDGISLFTPLQNGVNYQWYYCSDLLPVFGETTNSFTPTDGAYYYVVVSNICGVDTSDCISIENNSTNNFQNLESIKINNPVIDDFLIFHNINLPIEFSIVNYYGSEIMHDHLLKNQSTINVSKLAVGFYFLIIENKVKLYFLKL